MKLLVFIVLVIFALSDVLAYRKSDPPDTFVNKDPNIQLFAPGLKRPAEGPAYTTVPPTTAPPPTCVVPPPPKNGKMHILGKGERPKVGDLVDNYVIDVSCDRGYFLTGWILVGCDWRGRNDKMPECVPLCKKSTPELISCGDGETDKESRCLVPLQGVGITTKQGTDLTCGEIPRIVTTSVAGGRRAGKKEMPWHVGVYKKTTKPYMQICGGTLVAPQLVISAAHCFWTDVGKKQPAANYALAAGKIFRPYNDREDPDAQYSDVDEIRIPPRYQGVATNFQDDIALVFASTPFQQTIYVVPACLDFEYDFDETQLTHGRKGKVGGWGLTSEDGPPSQVLRVAELPVVDIEKCIENTEPGYLSTITSDKICAGYNNGTAVCRGDSGGGFLIPEILSESYRYFLRGVVSTAPRNNHRCNVYSAARFTHINKHQRFIMKAISQIRYTYIVQKLHMPADLNNGTDFTNILKILKGDGINDNDIVEIVKIIGADKNNGTDITKTIGADGNNRINDVEIGNNNGTFGSNGTNKTGIVKTDGINGNDTDKNNTNTQIIKTTVAEILKYLESGTIHKFNPNITDAVKMRWANKFGINNKTKNGDNGNDDNDKLNDNDRNFNNDTNFENGIHTKNSHRRRHDTHRRTSSRRKNDTRININDSINGNGRNHDNDKICVNDSIRTLDNDKSHDDEDDKNFESDKIYVNDRDFENVLNNNSSNDDKFIKINNTNNGPLTKISSVRYFTIVIILFFL